VVRCTWSCDLLPFRLWSRLLGYGNTNCCISQCPMHYPVKFDAHIFIQSGVIDIFLSHNLKIQDGGGRHLKVSGYVVWPFRRVDSVVFEICTTFGSNICYSNWDRCTYAYDFHLITSREFTSGSDFWSRGHLRMAMMHLSVKFSASTDIFIQSGVIHIFYEIQDGGSRHLGFSGYVNLAISACW